MPKSHTTLSYHCGRGTPKRRINHNLLPLAPHTCVSYRDSDIFWSLLHVEFHDTRSGFACLVALSPFFSPNSSSQVVSRSCYPRSGWLLDGVAPSRFRDSVGKCLKCSHREGHGSLLTLASVAQKALVDVGSYNSSKSTARSILCQNNGEEVLWVVGTRDAGAERPLFASTVCDHVYISPLLRYYRLLCSSPNGGIKRARFLGVCESTRIAAQKTKAGGAVPDSDLSAKEGTDKVRATTMAI
jgi:hypothetical protein